MRCLTLLLALLTIAGCAAHQPQPTMACAPAVEELAGNLKFFEQRPGHWNYGNVPEYSFAGQPGEVVTLIVRPANQNMGAALLKRSSHNSWFALDDFATASYVVCPDGPRLQVTATLPPIEGGTYYFMIAEHRGIPKLTADTRIALVSGPLTQQDPHQMAPSALTTQLTAPGPGSTSKTADIPEPIYGNTGKYMSPFTEDGTIAPWVEKSMAAAAGAGLGGAVGAYAGQKALEQVPFFGGLLGSMAGKAAGREIALNAAGGWDFIRANSDLSFNSLDDMARYLQAHHASHPQYAEVLKATYEIYPELQQSIRAVGSRR